MRSSNPVLNENTFASQRWGGIMADLEKADRPRALPGVMTVQGCAIKTGILLTLCTAAAVGTYWWATAGNGGSYVRWIAIGGGIAALVLSLIISFAQKTAPFLAPIYALVKGSVLGVITLMFAKSFQGIVAPAIGITLGIAFAMALAYAFGLIRIGQTFMKVIVVATLGLMLFYLAQFVLGMMGITFLSAVHKGGPIGIAFSLFVIVLASLNLVLTFQLADDGVKAGAPKYMEWYVGFGILVELAWLYIEVLRLLSKLRSNN